MADLRRAAVVYEPTTAPYMAGIFGYIAAAAPTYGVEITDVQVRNISELDSALATLGQHPNTGVIVPPAAFTNTHSALLIALAAKYRLPSIYAFRNYVAAGGLISYGVDGSDLWTKAAGYVDRILRGAKPGDLPVQAPTKFELVNQSQDREGARPRNSADPARPRRRGDRMKRREFITLLGGAAAAWPLAARAQQRERVRRIGVLLPAAADDPEYGPGSGRSCKGCSNRAGPLAATCASTPAGPRPMPPKFANTPQSWPRSRPMSFWPMAPDRGAAAAGDPHRADRVPDPSIRSAPVSSTAWRGRAAMSPVS